MRSALVVALLLACGAPRPRPSDPTSNEMALGPPTDDLDADALPDADDRCPCAAEDDDDVEDTDGCPEDDDRDRIDDACDLCPREPETYNGIDDEDGCPDRGVVGTFDVGIEILERISFPPDSADLDADAAPVLDAVAAALLGNPQLLRVEVRGHAEAAEPDPGALSIRRASAVHAALLARGIAGERLSVAGMGSTVAERAVTFEVTAVAPEPAPRPAERPPQPAPSCRAPARRACREGPFEAE